MRENPPSGKRTSVERRPIPWKQCAILAAIIAVIQAFLTINGRGVEGFILWIIILFVAYWLFFMLLIWLWRAIRRRT